MRIKIHPPCHVRIKGQEGILNLRRISFANREMKQRGWKGLVAHVQNECGTGLVEYRKLVYVTVKEAEQYYAKHKFERTRYIIGRPSDHAGTGHAKGPPDNRLPEPGKDGGVV